MSESPVACSLTDADLVRACAPEQPGKVAVGQVWMNVESGESYPVVSVRGDVIQRGELLVRLGSESYAVLLSERDLRDRCSRDLDECRDTLAALEGEQRILDYVIATKGAS